MSKLDDLVSQRNNLQKQIDAEKGEVKVDDVIVTENSQNKYLIMDFWEFAIISTLMTVFFPWSLLYCVVFYGLTHTKLIILAMLHDLIKTVLAVLSIVLPILAIIIYLILSYKS